MADVNISVTDSGVTIAVASGQPGVGVPGGGTTGQVLAKASNASYDTQWVAAGGGNKNMTVDTQDFTASGTWSKPQHALWVEVTMCGAGMDGAAGQTWVGGNGGSAGRSARKTFLAADLPNSVSVTCGANQPFGNTANNNLAQSSFGTYLYAGGPGLGPNDESGGSTIEAGGILTGNGQFLFGQGGSGDMGTIAGKHGSACQGGGGGMGGDLYSYGSSSGFEGGLASTGRQDGVQIAEGGGGSGGAAGANNGHNAPAAGYDTVTGFGHGGGGGGEGLNGHGGDGGNAVRGGGGGGGGKGTTTGGAGGSGGDGFVRVRTICFG